MLVEPPPWSRSIADMMPRISVDRMRRTVLTPPHARSVRFVLGAALLFTDFAVLFAGAFLRTSDRPQRLAFTLGLPLVALVLPALLGCYLAGGYRLSAIQRHARLSRMALAAGCGAIVGLIAYKAMFAWLVTQDGVLRFTWATAMAAPLYAGWVVLSRWPARRLLARRERLARIVFIGPHRMASELRSQMAGRRIGHPVVAVDDDAPTDDIDSVPISRLDELLVGHIKAVVLARPVDSLPPATLQDLVHARLLDVPIMPLSLLCEELWERTPITASDPGWFLQEDRMHPSRSLAYQGCKRLIDIAAAALGLIIAAPLMAFIAVVVRSSSPGPALFRQVRLGRWKEPFTILKFRSMRIDAEKDGACWATSRDPRVTRFGRFLRRMRFDELPQLWNVLIGDMTLVGPRPERPEFTEQLEAAIPYYDLRHLVKPGLTGWAQVCYPYGANVEDAVAKLEYEIYYIKNASLRFDARIILRTVGIVLGRSGV